MKVFGNVYNLLITPYLYIYISFEYLFDVIFTF